MEWNGEMEYWTRQLVRRPNAHAHQQPIYVFLVLSVRYETTVFSKCDDS